MIPSATAGKLPEAQRQPFEAPTLDKDDGGRPAVNWQRVADAEHRKALDEAKMQLYWAKSEENFAQDSLDRWEREKSPIVRRLKNARERVKKAEAELESIFVERVDTPPSPDRPPPVRAPPPSSPVSDSGGCGPVSPEAPEVPVPTPRNLRSFREPNGSA